MAALLAAAPLLLAAAAPPGATNTTTGEITNATALSRVLPLKQLRLLPADGSVVGGRDAVTLVFSRAVIALGSNFASGGDARVGGLEPLLWNCSDGASPPVPGRLWWVTTAILRFDPSEDWPNDISCTVGPNPALRAFDGTRFVKSSAEPSGIRTAALALYSVDVRSAMAANATDGAWRSRLRYDESPECPPDAVVTLYFSHPVDASMLRDAMCCVSAGGGQCHPVTVRPMKWSNLSVEVELQQPLATNGEYALRVPQGTKVSRYAGRTKAVVSQPLHGIYPFSFAWTTGDRSVRSPNLLLFARHGLDNLPGDVLKKGVRMSPEPGSFEVIRSSATQLRLAPALPVSGVFNIDTVADAFADRFGMELEAGTSPGFTPAQPTPFAAVPDTYQSLSATAAVTAIARGATSWNHSSVYRTSCSGRVFRAAPVTPASMEAAVVLASGCNGCEDKLKAFFSGCPAAREFGPQPASADVVQWPINVSQHGGMTLLCTSPVRAPWESACTVDADASTCALYSSAPFTATAVVDRTRLTMWAVRAADAAALSGATVTVFDVTSAGGDATVSVLVAGSTDGDGVVSWTISQPTYSSTLWASIEHDGALHLQRVPMIRSDPPQGVAVRGDVVADRALYRTGETVHGKGFAALYSVRDGTRLSPTVGGPVTVSPPGSWPVAATNMSAWGTFEVNVTIPDDAPYGPHTVSVLLNQINGFVGKFTVTVADPREPTGVLLLDTPEAVFKPQTNALPLRVTTQTYLGDNVPGSTVVLRWTLSTPGSSAKPTAEQVLHLKSGDLNVTLSLPEGALSLAEAGQSTLDVTATWLDAARDLLTQTIGMPVKKTSWQVTLTSTVDGLGENPPGYPLTATATLTAPKGDIDPIHPPEIGLRLQPEGGQVGAPLPAKVGSPVAVQAEGDAATVTRTVEFKLPAAGRYEVIADFKDKAGVSGNATLQVGRTEDEWLDDPLSARPNFPWTVDDGPHRVGQTATLFWFCPFSAARVMVMWGSYGDKPAQRRFFDLRGGHTKVVIPLGDECKFGCSAEMFVVSTSPGGLPAPVPTGPLFDLTAPVSAHGSVHIPVQPDDASLDVAVAAPAQVEPRSNSTIRVELTDPSTGSGLKGEVAVWVVNKALLDLLPDPLPASFAVQQPYRLSGLSLGTADGFGNLVSAATSTAAERAAGERVRADPWQPLGAWTCKARGNALNVDLSVWLSQQTQWVTESGYYTPRAPAVRWPSSSPCPPGPPVPGPPMPPTPPSPPTPPAPGPVPPPSPPSPSPSKGGTFVRTNFKGTALFAGRVETDASGKAAVQLTAPDNVGTWSVRVVAVAKAGAAWRYGSGERDVIARRPLSLNPSMPRIVRAGDTFQGGCTVTSEDGGDAVVSVAAPAAGTGVRLLSAASQRVQLAPKEVREVVFKFAAVAATSEDAESPALNATFTAAWAGGGTADAFQYPLPVLASQYPVTVTTSFALTVENSTQRWDEGLVFPPAVPGSGSVSVTAGVGRLSAVCADGQAVQRSVDRAVQHLGWDYATHLAASLAVAPAEQAYGYYDPAAAALCNRSFTQLAEYTDYNGLQDVPPWVRTYPSFVSLQPNAFALSVLRAIVPSGPFPARNGGFLVSASANKTTDRWRSAVVRSLYTTYQAVLQYGGDMTADVITAREGLGPDWEPSKQYPADFREAVSTDALRAALPKLPVTDQIRVCGILLDGAAVAAADKVRVSVAAKAWYNLLRVDGKTAYISAAGGSQHALPLSANAGGLRVFSGLAGSYTSDPLIEKLANYVAAYGAAVGASQQRWFGFAVPAAPAVLFAVARYDRATGSTHPDVTADVYTAGGRDVLHAHFESASTSPANATVGYAALGDASRPRPVRFVAAGSGQVGFSLGIDFRPADVYSNGVYFGLHVQKAVAVVGGDGSLQPYNGSAPLVPGQLVQVVVQVTSPDDLPDGVMIRDPLPAALQAQDPNLPTPCTPAYSRWAASVPSARLALQTQRAKVAQPYGPADPYAWFPDAPSMWGFPGQEVRKDEVRCFSPFFPAGTATCQYTAEVVTSGSFLMPPSKAFVPTEPGIMGLSNTMRFEVTQR
eukprot:TRINITY_DN5158_c1_g2_i1.p1 TRINITY_DN5158_c1_g2~~TRINITY_DN5158_c1_g2_i1.p1  ORF type:complete len:2080 (+),score=602.26 TRINITY_DN5158_c1_g2_i1:60-6242(+)